MLETALLILQIAVYALGGAVVALNLIAPLTRTDRDDKALVWLRRIEDILRRLLPAPAPVKAAKEPVAPAK